MPDYDRGVNEPLLSKDDLSGPYVVACCWPPLELREPGAPASLYRFKSAYPWGICGDLLCSQIQFVDFLGLLPAKFGLLTATTG